ncbi:LysE/ArgO family amino acid transporter [Blastococcus haudaquaticus]|uniref:L-lysine exporter family protein LysE/ArgO n=1 Tax=Blastococcus haudaquaticus TaxID=1938745 RepID=A0A286H9V8_9ACTN|nr:LysE/ArgO family amino acid transporter [Blastococcus haudaquaticus]SOE04034.1 L-lysine exporter family protein LysE/ArgO [Blastococcus haudaquaticus]
MTGLLAALAGMGMGLSLIVAIGAQNAFVLRQGLRLEHVTGVVAVCAVSDAVLILAGVAGNSWLSARLPDAITVIRVGGAVFLLGYAVVAGRRALRPAWFAVDAGGTRNGLLATIATCLALTWLNPHVYLDTVLLLGSVADSRGAGRWWFAGGAAVGSVLWFSALGYGARLLRPLFARPAAWRVLDVVIAVVMAALGVGLLASAI